MNISSDPTQVPAASAAGNRTKAGQADGGKADAQSVGTRFGQLLAGGSGTAEADAARAGAPSKSDTVDDKTTDDSEKGSDTGKDETAGPRADPATALLAAVSGLAFANTVSREQPAAGGGRVQSTEGRTAADGGVVATAAGETAVQTAGTEADGAVRAPEAQTAVAVATLRQAEAGPPSTKRTDRVTDVPTPPSTDARAPQGGAREAAPAAFSAPSAVAQAAAAQAASTAAADGASSTVQGSGRSSGRRAGEGADKAASKRADVAEAVGGDRSAVSKSGDAPAPGQNTGGAAQWLGGGSSRSSPDRPSGEPVPGSAPTDFKVVSTRTNGPVKTLQIQLQPLELGVVTVHLRLEGDTMKVEMKAESQTTADLLSTDSDTLRKALQAAGIGRDVSVSVTVADKGGAQVSTPNGQQQPAGQGFQGTFGGDRPGAGAQGQGGGQRWHDGDAYGQQGQKRDAETTPAQYRDSRGLVV